MTAGARPAAHRSHPSPRTAIRRPRSEDGHIMRRALFFAFALALSLPAPAGASSFLKRRVNDWLNDLNKSDKAATRSAAAFALGRMGRDAEAAVPDLAQKAAKDPDAG